MITQGNIRCNRMGRFFLLCALALCALPAMTSVAAGDAPYVGSKACGECHEGEYARFQESSKKAKSWRSIAVMAPKLGASEVRGCYACHTTGYGKGGFASIESTPHLADVGCETCHGPGARHAESNDTADIRRTPLVKDCEVCHDSARVKAFDFKPLVASGAH